MDNQCSECKCVGYHNVFCPKTTIGVGKPKWYARQVAENQVVSLGLRLETMLVDLAETAESAPRGPLSRSYKGSLGQAELHLRKAMEALQEARGFLPEK